MNTNEHYTAVLADLEKLKADAENGIAALSDSWLGIPASRNRRGRRRTGILALPVHTVLFRLR